MVKKSKRSKIIVIVPMTALILYTTGCQRSLQPRIYTSVQECARDRYYNRNVCESKFTRASELHRTNAPRYNNQLECENVYGKDNCERVYLDSRYFFIPYMRGFVAGRESYNQPIYGSSYFGYRSMRGIRLGNKTGQNISIPLVKNDSQSTTTNKSPSQLNNKSNPNNTTTNKSSPRGTPARGAYGRGSSVKGS